MNVRGKKRFVVLTLALVLVAAACREDVSQSDGQSGGDGSGEPAKVELPGALAYELMLPSIVAEAQGYYDDNNIDLSIVASSGSDARQAIMAGQFEFALLASVHVPIARLGGAPLKAIFSAHDLEIFSLVVRSDLEGEVDSVEDLEGMKVGYSDPGSGSWYMGSVFLRKAGLDPESDVEYVSLGADPGVMLTSLKEGRVDAFATWEPTTTRAIEEGIAYPVVSVWEPAEHQEWVGEEALSMVLVTREDVIAEKEDVVSGMVDATKKGMADVLDMDSQQIADLVLENPDTAELFEGLDPELAVAMFDKIKAGFGDGCLSRTGYETELDILLEYEVIEEEVPFEEFADTTWAGEC